MYTVTNFNHHVAISYNGVAGEMFPNANVQLLVSLGIIPCKPYKAFVVTFTQLENFVS